VDGTVAVIGGGIGGLTAALALTHRGIRCEVHERAPELHEIGAGLGVWPAPLRVYDRLGIGDDVRALSSTAEEFAARLGEPTIGVHRGELQALLVRSLPNGVVRTGAECTNVTQHGGSVTIHFADGSTTEATAAIGADGRRSAVRRIVFGGRGLHDCRAVGWRGTVDLPAGADWNDWTGESWGPGGRFGMLPIGGGRATWFAAARRFRTGGGLEEVAERFGTWHHPIPDLIAATDESRLWRDVIDDLWPRRRWSSGRVALLGDAAHPMTPDLGQGACQAILDAWVLADELAQEADVPAALRSYERRRRWRAGMVTLVARAATYGAMPESRLLVAARCRAASMAPASVALRQLAFVTGGP
jgi:2-polyprenyl-6-methoxyphenol hydroxylase-like FAD-dependent oxidoreductase